VPYLIDRFTILLTSS